jgi:hypothetical protein
MNWGEEGLQKAVKRIQQRVDIWLDEGGMTDGGVLNLKRTYSIFADEATENKTEVSTFVGRKRQIIGWKSEEAVSDAGEEDEDCRRRKQVNGRMGH